MKPITRKMLPSLAVLALALTPQASQAGLLGDAINKSINGHGGGPVWFEHAESFKGLDQVVIGQFSVVFIVKKVDYTGGGFLSTSAAAKAIGQLSGPSEADYLRVTDAIYADFLKKLAASGVKLVDPAAYYASTYYQKVTHEEQGHKVTIPLQDKDNADGVAYWPSALPNHDNMALNLRFMDMHLRDVHTAQYDYARNAKVPVLNVVYVVDFAEPAKSSGARMLQSVKVSAELAISNRGSQFTLMDTSGTVAKLVLNKPLVEAGGFAEINDITSGVQKTAESAQMVGNLLGALGGHGSNMFGKQMRMDRRFDFHVTDPANYADMVTHAGGQANDLMVGQLSGAK